MKQIAIQTDDGAARAFEAGSGPSALLFIDGVGMRPAMHELGEQLAAAGYHVLMPDVFWRAGNYTAPDAKELFTGDPSVREAWFKLARANAQPEMIMRDTKAYLAHLPGKVGITGYCMGGRLAMLAAGTYPDRVAAAAAYHPGGLATDDPASPHLLAAEIEAALFIGAARDDASFDAAQQARLSAALDAAHVDYTLEQFAAKHGWVPSDTPVHDAAATARHWTTLRELFARALK